MMSSSPSASWLHGVVSSVPRGWQAATSGAQRNAHIIIEEFEAAGQPPGITLAALVNAYAESQWNAGARGDGGWSIGLFQLNRKGGAGKGMTEAQTLDPRLNTRRILREVDQYGGALRQAWSSGATVAELAAIYSRDIERPRDRTGEMRKRREMTAGLFGAGVAGTRANAIGFGGSLPPIRSAPLVAGSLSEAPSALGQLRPAFWLSLGLSTTIGVLAAIRATR
jgi:hypothetical protein